MKIAISSDESTIEGNINPRFGRCKYLLVVEIADNKVLKTEALENEGAAQGHGAGIKAAEQIGDLGVDRVITGQTGPNASMVLDRLGISVYQGSGKILDAISQMLGGTVGVVSEKEEPHGKLAKKVGSRNEIIFFPLIDNKAMDSEISLHFGHAPYFGIYDVGKKELRIIENNLDHTNPSKSPVDQIEEAVNPTTVFAKDIGGRAIGLIHKKGWSLKTGDYRYVGDAIKDLDRMQTLEEDCGHGH